MKHLLPRTQKQQLRLHQQASNLDIDDDNDDSIDITDVYVAYRRPKLVHYHEEGELSDYVITRLAMARKMAMDKYRELHG